jgi:hypothetical protein
MSIPIDRATFSDYCLRKLGKDVIQINVSAAQIDDRISEALYEFYMHNYQAVETVWARFSPTHEDVQRGYTILPPEVLGVSELYTASNSSNIYSMDFQMRLAEIQSLSSNRVFAGINYYYSLKMHMDLLNQIFSPDPQFVYNPLTRKLLVGGGLKNTKQNGGILVIKVFQRIIGSGDTDFTADSSALTANIWSNRWLQKYATALIMQQWSQNLSKYQTVTLLGGATMNGMQMLEKAEAEIIKLEDELRTTYELPPSGFMG